MKIGEILLEKGVLDRPGLDACLARQKKEPHRRIGDILLEAGLVSEEQLLEALAEQLELPFLREIEHPFAAGAAGRFPFEFWQRWTALPVRRGEDLLVVSTDPLSLPLREIESATGEQAALAFGPAGLIAGLLERNYWKPDRRNRDRAATTVTPEFDLPDQEKGAGRAGDRENPLDLANKAPVIRLVNQIIYQAVQQKASDVHLQPREKDFRVRYRVDGVLHDAFNLPVTMHPGVISRIKILSGLNIAERRLPQDGRTTVHLENRAIDIRVSILPTYWGEGGVLRLLDQTSFDFSLGTLGLYPDEQESIRKMIFGDHGIILLTGPTGSGKTTTLYAALQEINSPEKNIVTLEDPVEYQIPGVSQIQANPAIGLNFAAGLRSILRHDPDVMMIGEIRDRETAEMAVQSSLTGHLVFSTLHTNDAPSAVTRLMEMGVEPYLISSSILGVIAQRLVRVNCPECREELRLPGGVLNSRPEGVETFQGRGCNACFQTGFRGRLAIFEFFVFDDRARQMIIDRKSGSELKKHAVRQGMRTLRLSGENRVVEGLTTIDEVLRVTS